ncbi:hypothetical protein DFH09DRAFT_1328341 [Mycena vulgaris]|nr:hypothetical protein DFH09DRAFT_1328341 [Mycena vulgaris]
MTTTGTIADTFRIFTQADAEASTEGADADDEGEGDIVGSEDSDEEGESSDDGSVAFQLFIDDAGASDAEQDDAMYDQGVALGNAQDSDEGATDENQAHFAAAVDVDMEQEIFGGDDSDSDV